MNEMVASPLGGLDGTMNILDKIRLEGGINEFTRPFRIVNTVFAVAWMPSASYNQQVHGLMGKTFLLPWNICKCEQLSL